MTFHSPRSTRKKMKSNEAKLSTAFHLLLIYKKADGILKCDPPVLKFDFEKPHSNSIVVSVSEVFSSWELEIILADPIRESVFNSGN